MSIAQARLPRESQSKKLTHTHTVTVRGHVIGFLSFDNESDSILATIPPVFSCGCCVLVSLFVFTLVGHLQISVSVLCPQTEV